MVTLTTEEFEKLTPDERKEHQADEEMTVFGRTKANEPAFKKVKGQPLEMGSGSPGHESPNHFASIRKYEGEAAYQAALAEIWKRDPERAKKIGLARPKETKAA